VSRSDGAPRRWTRRASRLLFRVAAATLPAGCLQASATTEGRDITTLYQGAVIVAGIIAAIVLGLAAIALVRFRDRGDGRVPVQRRGSLPLELAWTGAAAAIVVGLFVATIVVLARVDPVDPPAAAVELDVTAFRWGWTFTYPGTGVTVTGAGVPGPEAVLPVDEPVRVVVRSADVDHSFYVPRFLFKRDAIPGRVSSFTFTIDEPGTYRGQCAEFCGIGHSQMLFSIRGVTRPEYDQWVATMQAEASPAPTVVADGPPVQSPSPEVP
jgi:cytochrome c oxidase subunit 2